MTDENGNILQVLDYYPYGTTRIDEHTSYDSKSKFTGQKLDAESGIYYYNSRYYNQEIGRFTQIDPLFWALGTPEAKAMTDKELQELLQDPQGLNAYAYSRNNPVRYLDENGEWFKEFLTGQQSWPSFQQELGEASQYLYDNSTGWKTAMDHPVATGAVVGIGGGLAAYGAAGGLGALGIVRPTIIGSSSTQINKLTDYTVQYGERNAEKMVKVTEIFNKEGIKISDHALYRTISRDFRGVTPEKVINAFKGGTKYLDKAYNNFSYFKDGIRVVTDEAGKIITVVTQKTMENADRFIKIK